MFLSPECDVWHKDCSDMESAELTDEKLTQAYQLCKSMENFLAS